MHDKGPYGAVRVIKDPGRLWFVPDKKLFYLKPYKLKVPKVMESLRSAGFI